MGWLDEIVPVIEKIGEDVRKGIQVEEEASMQRHANRMFALAERERIAAARHERAMERARWTIGVVVGLIVIVGSFVLLSP